MKRMNAFFLLMCFILTLTPVLEVGASGSIDPLGIEVYENGMSREDYYSQSISQYSAFDYSDPMTTTDEELFGQWDSNAQVWTVSPALDYTQERLKEIEEAAKTAEGDYDECKQLIYDYYNAKFDSFHLAAMSGVVQDYVRLTAEMRFENWTTRPALGPRPMSKLLVSKDAGWITSTVYDAVSGVIKNSDKQVTLHLYSLKKDGYKAIFDSSEGKNAPYIEVTVNGVRQKFYAVEDTYVAAGINSETNYSEKNVLVAEESYSSIGLLQAANEYTRRSVLKFDFSSINDTDKVTTATLNIYGHMEKSEDPGAAEADIEKDSKIVFVLNDTTNNIWKEDKLTWNNYFGEASWVCLCYDGTAGYVNESIAAYYPGVVQYRSSIMGMTHALNTFTNYYNNTKDETFGYHLIRETLHKIRELNADFDSTEQPTLNLIRTEQLIKIMDKTRNSIHMTPEIFTVFLKSCYEHAEAIVGADKYADCRDKIWTPTLREYNIGTLQTKALLELAIVFDEFTASNAPLGEEWRENAYNGGWKEVAKNRVKQIIDFSMYPDGSVTDVPLNYVWTNMAQYVTILKDYPIYYNYDVTEIFDEDIADKLIAVAEYVSNVSPPNFGMWQLGDGGNYAAASNANIKYIAKLFPEKATNLIKFVGSNRLEGMAPDYTSYASDYIQKAVLRSGWDSNAVAMHIQSNSANQHTHYDDLGVTLYAYGNYLLADPTRYNYSTTSEISEWQKSREAHNTVVLDGKNGAQVNGSLTPDDREFNNIYDYLKGTSTAYQGHLFDRHVTFVKPGYYIITDFLESTDAEQHNYRQNWHFRPDANISLDSEALQTKTNYTNDANIVIAAVMKSNELNSEVCEGYYSHTANQSSLEMYDYVSYSKNSTGNTTFQTVIYPTQLGETADIQTEVLESTLGAPDARAMRAIIKDSVKGELITDYYILLDEEKKTEVTYGTYKTNGTMALSEYTNDNISTLILRNGTYLEDTAAHRKLLVTATDIEDIGVSIDNSNVTIESTKTETVISGLTVYVGNKNITGVTYNGQGVEFGKSGKYVYVGGAPAYEIPPEDNTTNEKENNGYGGVYVSKGHAPSGSVGGFSKETGNNNTVDTSIINPQEPTIPDEYKAELASHWAQKEMDYMINRGYVKGDGVTLGLSNEITRAEFVSVIVRALALKLEDYKGIFEDVNSEDWYAKSLESAYLYGLLSGYEGKAEPNAPITREQMAKILVNSYELLKGSANYDRGNEYTDSEDMSEWAKEYISKCTHLSIMNGYEDKSFGPKIRTIRAEAFVTIYRLINLIE